MIPITEFNNLSLVSDDVKDAMIKSFELRMKYFGDEIIFFPEPYTPLSVTGLNCELNCRHCSKHYLRHMIDASDERRLISSAIALKKKGKRGIILSGGSLRDGSVPTYKFSDAIKEARRLTGLHLSAHTGIVDESRAKMLKDYGLEVALVDVIGDDETIHEIFGIELSSEDYRETLRNLSNAGIKLAPHIIVGLYNSKLKGEFNALRIVKDFSPMVVVIVVFIPTENTPMEHLEQPSIEDVVKVIVKAREMFYETPIALSCVRPGGRYRSILDEYAIFSGIDRIAVPSKNAYKVAERLGLEIKVEDKECCTLEV